MDYSTRSRTELIALCKARGLSGAGTNDDLIERLEAQDAETAGQGADDDPLAEDAPDDAPDVEPAPADPPAAETPQDEATVSTPAAEPVADTASAKPGKSDEPQGPQAHVKEGVTGNVYRFEFYLDRDIDDDYHRHLIRETHHNAQAAGHVTKGFPTVGHRVRYDADATGKRTAVYEVYLKTVRRP